MKLQLKPFSVAPFLVAVLGATACVTATVDPSETEDDTVAEGDGDGDASMTPAGGAPAVTPGGSGGLPFGSGGTPSEPLPVEAFLPMTVTDYYAASGFMGMDNSMVVTEDTPPPDEVEGLTMDPLGCIEEDRPEAAAGECFHVRYQPQYLNCTALELETDPDCENGTTWVGMFFQSPSMNWGELQGTVIEAGATKVVFYAWTDGEEMDVNFLAGGVGNLGTAYADTFKVETPLTITATPTQYEVSLASATYEDVIAAFGWTIEAQGMAERNFYLDDIRWVSE
jgi:hypothetical protein